MADIYTIHYSQASGSSMKSALLVHEVSIIIRLVADIIIA